MGKTNMVFALTQAGQAIKFTRSSWDGKGPEIKLAKGDKIVTSFLYNDEDINLILYVTSNGFGVRVKLSDIRAMGPGGAGVKFAKITPKTGTIVIAYGTNEKSSKGLEIISTKGGKIKIDTKEIPILNRGSQGVKIFKLAKGESVKDIS